MSRLLMIPIFLAAAGARAGEEPTARPAFQLEVSGNGATFSVSAGAPAPAATPAPARAPRPSVARDVSLPAAGEPFTPDVYPSRAEAARGLGEVWARLAAGAGDDAPQRVRVYCCDPADYAAIADGMRKRLPDARIEKAPPDNCPEGFHDGSPEEGETWVLVDSRTDAHIVGAGSGARGQVGTAITLTARGAADATASADYVQVPWLENFNAFARNSPGRRFVVARSDPMRPAMTQAEAAEAARRAAAGQVFGLVRQRVPRHGRLGADDGWLYRRVEQALAGGRMVVEEFPQKFERHYGGTTWRSAVLVDASEPSVSRLAGELAATRGVETRSLFMRVASGGGVLLVTYLLYRLANAFTRGYFVWSLRTTAAVVATTAVVLLLMVVG